MSTPIIVGAAVGAGIGASQGGFKGAVVGAGVGAGVGAFGPSLITSGTSNAAVGGIVGPPTAAQVAASGNSIFTTRNIFTGFSVLGTLFQTLGVARQAQAASNEAEFRAAIAANNAIIAANNAQIALEKGEADVADKRRETRQIISIQRAQLAAQGFSVSEGSSIDILGDTAALGELDVLRIEADAENRAENFRQQGAGFQAESTLGTFAAKNIKKAGTLKATSTLITGVTTAGLTQLALKP